MKPLELHIYDKHPDADAYRVGGFYSPYCLVSKDKRFSAAELAAEGWRAKSLYLSAKHRLETFGKSSYLVSAHERERGRLIILDRFATLPNYDEADQ